MTNQTHNQWPAYVRTVALVCWSLAVVMTAALGWSAWQAYDTAGATTRHVEARLGQDVSVASKPVSLVARQ
ncbi:hypothetical protein [Maricaulis parjimensis]|uniref:hypothetical protein n=1 Tax=Maricaulis parjimensis TaxID=144023 RepID=UPI00193A5B82|nr:hypothetical protein [Maricaulis parjimensis]